MADANLVARVLRHKIICEEINDLYDRKIMTVLEMEVSGNGSAKENT